MSRSSSLTHQISRAVAWNTLLAPLKTVTELVANIIILNVLPLPHVGMLRLVGSAAATLGIWVDLGIDRSLPRFIPELEERQGRAAVGHFMTIIFLIKGLLLLLFGVVFLFLSDRFVNIYLLQQVQKLPDKFDAIRTALLGDIVTMSPWLVGTVLALVVLGSFYDGLMAYLISYFRQRAWNIIGLVGSVVQPFLAATLVLLGKGVGGVLVAMVVTPVLSVGLAGWQVLVGQKQPARHEDGEREREGEGKGQQGGEDGPVDNRTGIQRVLWRRFGVYTGMSNVLNLGDYFVSWYFAVFLLNDLAQIALFTTGTAMVRQVLALLYTPLIGIQVPFFTRVKEGQANLSDAYAAIGRILALVLIPGGAGLMLLAHELILVQYPQYADAVLAVYILTPCLFLESFLSSAQIVLQVHERYRLLILPRLLTLVILPLIVWGALNYGLVGAAFAVGGGRVLTALATAVMAQRAFPLRYSWLFFGRITLATLGMTGVVVGLKHVIGLSTVGTGLVERLAGAGVLLMVAAAGAASFVVLLRLMGGLEEDDYRRILESRLPLRHWLVKVL